MEEFIATLSLVANLVTVLAGVIALAGVLWASLSRAKLTVTPSIFPALTPQLTITVASTGSNPVHDLEVSGGALDNNGFSMWADRILHRPVLARGQWLTVAATGDNQSHQRSPVIESEYRHPMTRDEGAYLNFQWRSPLFPWRRSSVTYVWPPSLRFASRNPRRLTGRAESRFFRRASDQQNNDSHLGFRPPKWSPARATQATDENFTALVSSHDGPVVVGFGNSLQGQWWQDVQRMLDAFAANHAPHIKVVTVTMDHCPTVAEKFPTGVFPHFKVFHAGRVVGSHDGVGSMLDLEAGFADHLR